MRAFVLRVSRVTIIAALTACGPNWHSVTVPSPQQPPDRRVFEFHAGEQLVRLHGVRFERDSLSGVDWLAHTSCDSCRVRYAYADISEPRVGDPGAGAWNIMLPFVALMTFFTGLALAFANYT